MARYRRPGAHAQLGGVAEGVGHVGRRQVAQYCGQFCSVTGHQGARFVRYARAGIGVDNCLHLKLSKLCKLPKYQQLRLPWVFILEADTLCAVAYARWPG